MTDTKTLTGNDVGELTGEPEKRGPRIRPDNGGFTVGDLAKLLRVSPDRIRAWIKSNELSAINTGSQCRPRFVVLPHHLQAFEQRRQAGTPARSTPRTRRKMAARDFYPD